MTSDMAPRLSVVVPLYNEEDNVPELCGRLAAVLDATGLSHEVVLVDDGSSDATWDLVRRRCDEDRRFRGVSFSRNFGHQTAITAGLDLAEGAAVVVMDGDLQDPPEVLPAFIDKWRQGFDVVYAIRERRKENVLKRACYALFYRVLQRISYLEIPLDSGDFCLMDRRVVDALRCMPERNRFVRGLRTWAGFRQTGLRYERPARKGGRPKYTFAQLVRLAANGVVSFSFVPLSLISSVGMLMSVLAFVWGTYVLVWRILAREPLPGYATIMIAILLVGGLQLLAFGILGQYVAQVYDEVKGRPHYLVRSLAGFEEDSQRAAAARIRQTLISRGTSDPPA